jgi:hypothetical protein
LRRSLPIFFSLIFWTESVSEFAFSSDIVSG